MQVKNGEITKTYGVISEGKLNKEVNLISWNGRKEQIDIRGWNDTHTECGKGVVLSMEEAKALRDILNKMEL
ncbi:MAG: PC4/YdbC family ssDNA-binding protein [Anaerotignum sp.]|nr:PC4/YdbC family ssDNA-binding protein [Anaerotignum sp.]